MSPRHRSTLMLFASAAALLFACSSKTAINCPDDEPSSCTMPAPSYQTAVAPIIAANCVAGCHSPGGTSSDKPLQTYDQVFAIRVTVLSQLATCAMPQPPSPQLDAADRATVFDWLVCNAPDN